MSTNRRGVAFGVRVVNASSTKDLEPRFSCTTTATPRGPRHAMGSRTSRASPHAPGSRG